MHEAQRKMLARATPAAGEVASLSGYTDVERACDRWLEKRGLRGTCRRCEHHRAQEDGLCRSCRSAVLSQGRRLGKQ